ncbi:conserved hypothetical protein [Leishmania braziliensis MHOM/BR/75/M2904]|uniref:CCR4-NOT transcription complex subunit 11 n=2 Tax=Leishmania braziliensis TaxID=5660 RepID=A4HCL4_LEIBR|nr:conserved hypothetical protein [Leishmania braziliensis MHOM/BR/75/M2904]KAI5688431.1 hypothetical protein MNV84_03895 [Leishmania braziliensis]CAJ2473056.1 unnamed protein product [Leishmania braziliensis]CAJ2473554.1 unnamed protein product [Leishmania braziliensis]CAM36509.2 conserved hypothetical protein [Leishmania braziliensis MHOM/BR/75/M2904]SYZ65981.1 hypothetical_protein [Leishmania braziliensis MHOM/BR/75/M2904]
MCKEFVASTEGTALLAALYIVDYMRKQDNVAAKSTFYDVLIELEHAIRRDMFIVEQIKYTTKESKEGKKSMEATRAEAFRIHCAAKVFAFQLLGDVVADDEKVVSYASKKQESIDEALNAWEKASVKIKEPMADIEHCWVAKQEKQQCGSLYGTAAVFDEQPNKTFALLLPSITAKLPMLPMQEGELQYVLPGKSGMLLLDSAPPSEGWMISKRLLVQARKSKLSKDDEQALLGLLNESLVSRLGVSPQQLSELATHNPEVCASVLLKLPSGSAGAFIQFLLKGNIPEENMQTILLRASSVLQQVNVRTFISTMIHKLRERGELSTGAESVKNFALSLHQLVMKAAKENREIFIADAFRPDLEQLFQSSSNPEVKNRWEDMKR